MKSFGRRQLRARSAARQVGGRDQRQVVAHHAEERVTVEVDAGDIALHHAVADRRAEAQPAVLTVERNQVPPVGTALEPRQLTDGRSKGVQCGSHRATRDPRANDPYSTVA